MRKILFILSLILTISIGALAQRPAHVPAYPGVIARVQPSGDTLHVYLRGDERHHFTMTTDGWQVMEDSKGKLCYCTLKLRSVEGEGMHPIPVRTCRVAHDAAQRSKCEQRWLNKHGVQKGR